MTRQQTNDENHKMKIKQWHIRRSELLKIAKMLDLHLMKGGNISQGHPLHVELRIAISKAEEAK